MTKGIVMDVTTQAYHLGELLAVIHRDGGQHESSVGYAQATTDAIKIVCDAREAADVLHNTIRWYQDTLDLIKSECIGARCDEKTFNLAERILGLARREGCPG